VRMTKLAKDAVLELETRRRVYETIRDSPGLHFRELERRLMLGYGTLQYHTEFLIKHNLVSEEKGKEYSRFFAASFRSIKERELLSLLRQKTNRHILIHLVDNPMSRNKDIAKNIELSPSTASWHLARLVETGAVASENRGNETLYRVGDPEAVTKLLITYKSSFIDKIVDRFIDVWEKEDRGVLKKPDAGKESGKT